MTVTDFINNLSEVIIRFKRGVDCQSNVISGSITLWWFKPFLCRFAGTFVFLLASYGQDNGAGLSVLRKKRKPFVVFEVQTMAVCGMCYPLQ